MSEVPSPAAEAPGLNQLQRVIYAFTAPSKTFADIKRGNRSWWLPFLLFVIIGTGLWAIVGSKVTWETVRDNGFRMSPKAADRINSLPPDQRDRQMAIATTSQKITWLVAPVGVLVLDLIAAGILLATINFGFGGTANFSQVLAVIWYGGLPGLLKLILGGIALYAGLAPEGFLPGNPAGTNLGFFLSPVDTNKILYGLATGLDVTVIWSLVITSIGLAIVAGVKRSSGYIAVFGWWVVLLLVSIGAAAAFS